MQQISQTAIVYTPIGEVTELTGMATLYLTASCVNQSARLIVGSINCRFSDCNTLEEDNMGLNKERALDMMKKFTGCDIYPQSLTQVGSAFVALTNRSDYKKLVCVSEGVSPLAKELKAERESTQKGITCKVAALTGENAQTIRRHISWCAPSAVGREQMSIGLGDRLGLATPAHCAVASKYTVKPVLAQQSVRECNLTARNFRNVLDCATWGVLQAGYQGGYGADGDQLKNADEIAGVLALGYSMITLDCSEKIDKSIADMSDAQVTEKYQALPETFRTAIETSYLDKEFSVGEFTITYNIEQLRRIVLTYAEALVFATYIYKTYLKNTPWPIDFELSIDETATVTTPQDHFLVANELKRQEVELTSVAPRFCGEFQKAIDYIGDMAEFEQQFTVHAAIADHFGYRLSIHSGSDKLSVYPIIVKHTKGRVHVKTAGTNWLEALRAICRADKALFRRICQKAHESFAAATVYYHVTTDLTKIPPLDNLTDDKLEDMLNLPDARQLLHITYGLILEDKELHTGIYTTLNNHEQLHYDVVAKHIDEHLQKLMECY